VQLLKEFLDRYVCSRFYLYDPPGVQADLHEREDAPESFKAAVEEMEEQEPDVNPWVCVVVLVITAGLMGFTTECVSSSHLSQVMYVTRAVTAGAECATHEAHAED